MNSSKKCASNYKSSGPDKGNTSGDKDGNGDGKEAKLCRIQDHNHLWKDCPNNNWSKNIMVRARAKLATIGTENTLHLLVDTATSIEIEIEM